MDIDFPKNHRINKNNPIPLYYQIADYLRDFIQSVDTRKKEEEEISLPTESELSDCFDVHRGTVRHALDILEGEGLIYRERGRGTFVQRKRIEDDISTLLSTTENLERRGWTTNTVVLDISKDHPQAHTANALKLNDESYVWGIHRLRIANDEPIGIQIVYIPVYLAPDLDRHDLTRSLTKTFEEEYGIIYTIADQTIRARKATSSEAKLLNIKENDPLIVVSGVSWDQYKRPIEDIDSFWRYDRYDIRFSHTRE